MRSSASPFAKTGRKGGPPANEFLGGEETLPEWESTLPTRCIFCRFNPDFGILSARNLLLNPVLALAFVVLRAGLLV